MQNRLVLMAIAMVPAAGHDGAGPPLVHKIYQPGHRSDMAFVLAAQNGVRAHHWPFGNRPPVEGAEGRRY